MRAGGIPVDELDDDSVRVSHLEGPLTPLLFGERHGDRNALGLNARELAVEVRHDEGEDQPAGTVIALVGRQGRQPAAQEDDVHSGVVARQGGEAVCRHLLPESEMGDEEAAGRGHVVDARITQRDTAMDDDQWWAANEPLLARVLDQSAYPLAVRVGSAAGAAQGGAYSPAHAYDFGLQRVLDGLAALIDNRR